MAGEDMALIARILRGFACSACQLLISRAMPFRFLIGMREPLTKSARLVTFCSITISLAPNF